MKIYRFRFFSALILPLVIHLAGIAYLSLQEEPLPPKNKQLVRVQTIQLKEAPKMPLTTPALEEKKVPEQAPEEVLSVPEPSPSREDKTPPPREEPPVPEEKPAPMKDPSPETKPSTSKASPEEKPATPKTPPEEKPTSPKTALEEKPAASKPPPEEKPAISKTPPEEKPQTVKAKTPPPAEKKKEAKPAAKKTPAKESGKKTSPSKKKETSTPKKKTEATKSDKPKQESDETLSAALEILSSLKGPVKETASKAVKGAIRAGQIDTLKSEGQTRFDSPEHRAILERSYQDDISYTMQGSLVLPEQGEVTVLLTLSSDGKVKTVKIKHAESSKNSRYVSEKVPHLRFPAFRDLFKGEKEHTFTITLCNK